MNRPDFSGLRATVMGLGLHGGGLASCRYLVERGAEVTATDLRDERALAPVLESVPPGVRLVLGGHDERDFRFADVVVKNPAVRRDVPLLATAPAITTDIALFLAEWRARSAGYGPLVAVTGTKGKSQTASAAAAIIAAARPGTRLGGNITVSPLTFVDELASDDPVVLELSSFQLGDLRFCREHNGARGADHGPAGDALVAALQPALRADVAIITGIFRDHQDYYGSMERYVADKREIYRHPAHGARAIFAIDDEWGATFREEWRTRSGRDAWVVSALTLPDDASGVTVADGIARGEDLPLHEQLVPAELRIRGEHGRRNVAQAALAALALGVAPEVIRSAAAAFPGIPHRLEEVCRADGVIFVNDTAATIPEAALAAVAAYQPPVMLIAGGTDKQLDLASLEEAIGTVRADGGEAFLLAGSATDRLSAVTVGGMRPYDSLRAAVAAAVASAHAAHRRDGQPVTVLLSPGAASFGMFANEFDRGERFRALALEYVSAGDR